jgi:hypothetical protein
MSEYGQSIIEQTHTLEGHWSYGGNSYKLEVEDISGHDFGLIQEYTQLAMGVEAMGDDPDNVSESDIEELNSKAENLDNFSWESEDGDTDLVQSVIQAKLVKPDVEISTTGHSKLQALFEGMMETWQESEAVKSAKEDMPLDEGNG